jgi:hypothetical protein
MEKQISTVTGFGQKLTAADMKRHKGGWGGYGPYPLYWYCDTRIWENICYIDDPEGCSNECGAPCTPDMNGCRWV